MSGQQFANTKYRNWVKAARGYKFAKEGLELFCDDIVKQQHADIIIKVKQKHNLTTSYCGQCNLRTLQPNHVRTKYKHCPLGQKDCNCQYPGGKVACPNKLCGAIYDEIINLHASTPPSPYWKNTDVKLWCSQPWAIARCFINAPGYSQKSTASEIDCSGLLHVLINNKGVRTHINCNITGTDVISKVREHRNTIFHSENMEIEDADVVKYIDDIIAVLQDSKELEHRTESKSAVQKLLQLKQNDVIITTSLEAEVKTAKTALIELHKELGQKNKDEMEQKGLNVESEIEQKGSTVKADVDQKGSDVKKNIYLTGSKIKAEVEQKGSESKAEVYQTGLEVMAEVNQKGSYAKAEVEQKGSEVMADVEETGTDVKAEVDKKGSEIRTEANIIELKVKSEIDQTGSDIQTKVKKIGLEVKADIYLKGSVTKTEVDKKGLEVKGEIDQKGSEIMTEVKEIGLQVKAEVDQRGSEVKTEVYKKGSEVKVEIGQKVSDVSAMVDQKGSDVIEKVEQTGKRMINQLQNTSSQWSESDEQSKNTELKKEFQTELLKLYNDQVIKLSPLPLLPGENDTDIVDIYVTPLMTRERQSTELTGQSSVDETQSREVSVHDIFEKEGKSVKLIYVIGEPGSGKSSFYQYLDKHWCVAHSGQSCPAANTHLVEEMKKYLYLVYFLCIMCLMFKV